jgi:uncharacterized membrane protein YcgQ (UPF0703/DUF1980 family)
MPRRGGVEPLKRAFCAAALLLSLSFSAYASVDAENDVFEVREKMFIAQTNDVYLNPDEYLGRVIRLEGLFGIVAEEEPPCYYVYRYGPGCCAFDSNAGFEVAWADSGASREKYPNEDDWVEATGVLEQYEYDGESYLRLALKSLMVKAERGLERVDQ